MREVTGNAIGKRARNALGNAIGMWSETRSEAVGNTLGNTLGNALGQRSGNGRETVGIAKARGNTSTTQGAIRTSAHGLSTQTQGAGKRNETRNAVEHTVM